MYWAASSPLFISIYHEVIPQESLEEAALAAATVTKDIAAEDAALGLFLLEVNLLISGHCSGMGGRLKGHKGLQRISFRLLLMHNKCLQSVSNSGETDLIRRCYDAMIAK